MIELLMGLPGGGKSYTAVKMLIETLVKTRAYVCTNLPLKLPELCAYIHEHYKETVDIGSRLRVLTDKEVCKFWHYLGPNIDASTKLKKVQTGLKMIDVPDYDFLTDDWPGVIYYLDEAHVHFSAYRWQEVTDEGLWIISQHRHLGMEIVLITQHPEQVAKPFRRLIERYRQTTNYGNRRSFGFVAPGKFRWVVTPSLPKPGGEVIISESGWVSLDKRIGECYDTNAGVGLSAKAFAVERRATGLNWKWLFVLIPLALAAVMTMPMALTKGINKALGAFIGSSTRAVSGFTKSVNTNNPPAAPIAPGAQPTNPVPRIGASGRVEKSLTNPADFVLTGVMMLPGKPESSRWTLSDGRVISPQSRGFGGGGAGWLNLDGKRVTYDSAH